MSLFKITPSIRQGLELSKITPIKREEMASMHTTDDGGLVLSWIQLKKAYISIIVHAECYTSSWNVFGT